MLPRRDVVMVPTGKNGSILQLEGLGWPSWYKDGRKLTEFRAVVESYGVVRYTRVVCFMYCSDYAGE